jgi:hypothetical protein
MNLTPNLKTKVGELFQNLCADWPENRAIYIVFHGHSVPAGYHRAPEVKPFDSYPHMVFQRPTRAFSYSCYQLHNDGYWRGNFC